MKTLSEQIKEQEKKLELLRKKLKLEQDKTEWVKISDDLEISNKQLHNGKTYEEIKALLKKGEEIADYPLLQKLRNSKKYEFLKEFWVFVPNPDKISKENNYITRFVAGSNRAYLYCDGSPADACSSLGCFLIRSINGK